MIDIALAFDPETFDFDLVLDGLALDGEDDRRDLQGDDGLYTAVIISLFTDARAHDDDPLPDESVGVKSDRRGWWGDCILPEEMRDPMGSRLWLLWREKEQAVVVERARQYAREALDWLLRDGHVSALEVTAQRVGPGHLGIGVRAREVAGADERTRDWTFVYDYENAAPVKIEAPGGV